MGGLGISLSMSLSFWTRSRRFSRNHRRAGAVVAREAGAIDELPRPADLDEFASLERLVVLAVLAVEDENGAGLVQDEVVAGARWRRRVWPGACRVARCPTSRPESA